jgi:VIT1/CCC1 family predicted Fe2+/Mn2+ transporter
VLGVNDGIISTASLVLGAAAAGADHRTVLLTIVTNRFLQNYSFD